MPDLFTIGYEATILDRVLDALLEAGVTDLVDKIGMEILSGPHVKYVNDVGNKGFTTVTIIKTSHISMHVWDELDPKLVQLDVYSCACFDPQDVFDHFESFEPVKVSYKFLDREDGMHEIDAAWTFKR